MFPARFECSFTSAIFQNHQYIHQLDIERGPILILRPTVGPLVRDKPYRKLTVVLDYYEAMETYNRIGLLRSYGNSQSYRNISNLFDRRTDNFAFRKSFVLLEFNIFSLFFFILRKFKYLFFECNFGFK